jgi:SpoVK/Ycf46/Vps4 family AAA+-type ATPase
MRQTPFLANFDDAYMRRFQSVVHFPMPDAAMRQSLFHNCLNDDCGISDEEVNRLAQCYEVTGSTIVNAVRQSWLSALSAGKKSPSKQDIEEGLRLELAKEGKSQ